MKLTPILNDIPAIFWVCFIVGFIGALSYIAGCLWFRWWFDRARRKRDEEYKDIWEEDE